MGTRFVRASFWPQSEKSRPRWLPRASSALLVTMAISGCSNLHLHSPTREAQGKDAQQKWQATDVNELIRAERERSAALLAEEITRVKSAKALSRDLILASMATGGSMQSDVATRIANEAKPVLGDGTVWTDLDKARIKQETFEGKFETRMLELRRLRINPVTCDDVNGDDAVAKLAASLSTRAGADSARVKAILTAVQGVCSKEGKDRDAVRRYVANAPVDANGKKPSLQVQELADYYAMKDRLGAPAASKTAREEYEDALDEYLAAAGLPTQRATAAAAPASAASGAAGVVKAAAPPASASTTAAGPKEAKLNAALAKLKNAIAKLKALGDKYSLQLVSEERIAAIDEYLGALLQPKEPGAAGETEADRTGRALQRIAVSLDGWAAAKDSAKETLLIPLQMQQRIEEERLQAINRSIAADAAALEIQKLRVDIVNRQAQHLAHAQRALSTVPKDFKGSLRTFMSEPPTDKATDDLLDKRSKVLAAVAHYGYARGELQGELDATTLQLAALENSGGLDASESNLRQWNTLIGGNVDLLHAWGATGVKDDTISKGINALLLLWIGKGVN